jgi:hypothetical protein
MGLLMTVGILFKGKANLSDCLGASGAVGNGASDPNPMSEMSPMGADDAMATVIVRIDVKNTIETT